MEEYITTINKGRKIVVPRAIQSRMGLKAGDRLRYSVKGNTLEIEKLSRSGAIDPFFSFTEWSSEADEKAFDHLKPKKN